MHFEILIIVSIISVIVCRGIEHSKDRMCNVLKIPSQRNFNLTKFQGKWYAAQKTTSEDSLLAYFMEIYDGRIIFTLNKEKNYDLRACEYIRKKAVRIVARNPDFVAGADQTAHPLLFAKIRSLVCTFVVRYLGGPGRVFRDTGILDKNLKGYGVLGSILAIWEYNAF